MAAASVRDEATELLRELIRLDTVNPPGNETRAAELLRAYLEEAGVECELSGSGAVDEHVLVACRLLGLRHRSRDVVHVRDQGPLRYVDARLVAGDDEDRHAVVVVPAPAAGRLERPPAGDDRARGHEFVDDLAIDRA